MSESMDKLISLTDMLRKSNIPPTIANTVEQKLAAATALIEEAQAELARSKVNHAELEETVKLLGEDKDVEIAQLQSDLKVAQDDLQTEKDK